MGTAEETRRKGLNAVSILHINVSDRFEQIAGKITIIVPFIIQTLFIQRLEVLYVTILI